jgi:hypothetical protein
MARGSSSEIRDIVSQFVGQLSALIEQDAVSRARDAILSAFSGGGSTAAMVSPTGRRRGRPPGRGRGRPPGSTTLAKRGRPPGRKRRKAPIQLCPVPGCTNRAAPVFGMVCSKHKDLPKGEIRKYREARRAQQKGAVKGTPARARKRLAAKPSPKPTPKAIAPAA